MVTPMSRHLVQETDCLQDEIRQLERDLNTLSHKSSTLSESCQRDCNEVEVLRRETLRVEADLREWKARVSTVAASVFAIQDSGRLLAGVETQARAALDQEVKRTRDQRVQMERTVMGAKLQARQVEEKMMGVEVYAQMRELEKKVSKGRQELEEKRRRSGGAGSRSFLLREDRNKWELVKKSLVATAEAWKSRRLAIKAVTEEAKALEEVNRNVARMREEQAACREEMRRRSEQEGWARLDKVSSEVSRMESVIGHRTTQQGGNMEAKRFSTEASCMGRNMAESSVQEFVNRDDYIKEGNASLVQTVGDDCSQAQRSGMVASEQGYPFPFSSASISSLSNYVPPTPRRLGVQLKLGTALLKKSPHSNEMPKEQPRSIQPASPDAADAVASPVQADLGQQQTQLQWDGDQQRPKSPQMSSIESQWYGEQQKPVGDQQRKPQSPQMSICPRRSEQQQASSQRLWRLPLPKLKSLVRLNRSTPEQTDVEQGSPTQMQQKKEDHTLSTTSTDKAMSTMNEQEDRRSSLAPPCAYPDSEKTSGNEELGCKSVPKLNLFSSAGLFKRSKNKDLVDGLQHLPSNISCDSIKQPHTQQRQDDGENCGQKLSGLVLPQSEKEVPQGNEVNAEVSQSDIYNQHASTTVPTQEDQQRQSKVADQDCREEGELEEDAFYNADGDDVAESGTMHGEGNGLEEGEIYETDLPTTSTSSSSPGTTPGKRRLPPLNMSPGSELSSKREVALKELLGGTLQEQEQALLPSLPKAPRLQLPLSSFPSEERSLEESDISPKERRNKAISFNMADLEQDVPKQVASPPASSSAIAVTQDSPSASKDLFGGGDAGFGFNFGADDTCDTEKSFSFFGGGTCKSPEQGEKDGGFFLNFGDGGGDKVEERGGWNFFGN